MANISAVEEKNVVSPEGTPPEGKKKKPKPKKKAVKRVVASLVVLATLGGITYGMFRLFHKTEPETRPDTTFVYRGSIMSTVTGNGVTKAEDSKTVMLTAGGKVLEVFVAEGDWVNEGDPLYVIDSAEAQKAVEDAQKGVESAEKTVADIGKQIAKIHESYGDLTVTAPFSGRLRDTPRLQIGDKVAAGTKIATLVDDTQLVLTLYFSYAYEADIYVGQAAVISVPATMSSVPARVREINYVRRITPEGSVLFQVTLEAENPGTLTEEMPASASLSSGGEEIHPYEAGKLENNRTSDVTAKVSGEVLDARLLDYAQVTAGQT
ncbi:MAG: HlyD family efflux transporter periplasmic adaptor subunit, partial [Oscillospiraceae bacterium]|nr:HlyD family efflux transporter periplasmic adaptor subunit [Oscillospiraceae bacterium]